MKGACEPRGTAPADVPRSKTAEDDAKKYGKAAAYADAVQRVRLPARARAAVRASARVRKRACVGCKCGACCVGVRCVTCVRLCMLYVFACVSARACGRLRMRARVVARAFARHAAMHAQSALLIVRGHCWGVLCVELHARSVARMRVSASGVRENATPCGGTPRAPLEYQWVVCHG